MRGTEQGRTNEGQEGNHVTSYREENSWLREELRELRSKCGEVAGGRKEVNQRLLSDLFYNVSYL